MKRFHVHLKVGDLENNIAFYSELFGQAPAKQKDDYAKWMLEDPRINFAISTHGAVPGLDHFGLQVDDEDTLTETKARARAAGTAILDEGQTQCCYARSEKHWTLDPQGLAWEHFVTMGDALEFGSGQGENTMRQTTESGANGSTDACCG